MRKKEDLKRLRAWVVLLTEVEETRGRAEWRRNSVLGVLLLRCLFDIQAACVKETVVVHGLGAHRWVGAGGINLVAFSIEVMVSPWACLGYLQGE